MASDLETQIRELLRGIDADYSSSDDAWWETSTGVKFGTGVLSKVIEAIRTHRASVLEEAAKVCESISQPYAIGESQECAEAIRALAAKTQEGDKPFPPKMRSQCNCPCHEPGTFILHCMPCCHPDQ